MFSLSSIADWLMKTQNNNEHSSLVYAMRKGFRLLASLFDRYFFVLFKTHLSIFFAHTYTLTSFTSLTLYIWTESEAILNFYSLLLNFPLEFNEEEKYYYTAAYTKTRN